MNTKIKIIILVFVLIAILYLVNFVVSTMNKMKKKETFIEMEIEEFTDQEQKQAKNYDVRLTILDEVEKFVADKEERIDIINQLFNDIDSYKTMSKDAVVKSVETFINKRQKEKFIDQATVSNDNNTSTSATDNATTKPASSTSSLSDIGNKLNKITTDIDNLYTNLGSIRTNMHDINKVSQDVSSSLGLSTSSATKPATTKTIETFVDGFENVRSFASYSPIL